MIVVVVEVMAVVMGGEVDGGRNCDVCMSLYMYVCTMLHRTG